MVMMINSSADADATFLPEWFVPSDRDVICGWARQNHRHAGNQRFRKLVEHSAPLYTAAKTKLEKTQVIASVVDKVRRDSPGGGFVKRDFHSGLWFEIGDDKARDKVGHAIRRAIEDEKKRKSKSKKAKQKLSGQASTEDADDASVTSAGKLPLPTLDDFEDEESSKLKKAKNIDMRSDLRLQSLLASQAFQEKSDSLVIPSFLYQQQNALANFQQENTMTPGSQSRVNMDSGFAMAPSSNLLAQNQPVFDRLSNQGVGAEDSLLPRMSQNQSMQLGAHGDIQSKLGSTNSMGQRMNSLLPHNMQSIFDDMAAANNNGLGSQFSNLGAFNNNGTHNVDFSPFSNHQNFPQLGGGAGGEMGRGLPSLFGGNNNQSAEPGLAVSSEQRLLSQRHHNNYDIARFFQAGNGRGDDALLGSGLPPV